MDWGNRRDHFKYNGDANKRRIRQSSETEMQGYNLGLERRRLD